ncbi:MAG: carbon-nitrogen hydrolase family protein [Deltaproteobacteria bacterium]|nr:carbon-nitrogen hydrolase family protein [Deltaproteobacteria bacterium]
MKRIGLVQTSTTDDFESNLNRALEWVDAAAAEGVGLAAFPEVFLYVGNREGKLRHAQPLNGPVVDLFRNKAAKHGVAVLLGSLLEVVPDNPDKVYNTGVLIGADGGLAAIYRKRNLFDISHKDLSHRESDMVLAGTEHPPVVDTPVGRVGMVICFDIRFPALFQRLRTDGAEVILVPANFAFHTGAEHWETLLRARAIETQCYVAAPAQVGKNTPHYHSYGHTALVDPWGVITAQASDVPGMTVGEINLDYLRQIRENLPLGF